MRTPVLVVAALGVVAIAGTVAAQAPVGPEFRVNTYTTYAQWFPSVATAGGEFVVVWMGPDGDNYGVLAQRFDARGRPLGSEFRVNGDTAGRSGDPWVAGDASGGFVVAWTRDSLVEPNEIEVMARRFDSSGQPITGDIPVNTYTPDYQFGPVVVSRADGGFVVVWNSQGQDGSRHGLFAQRFDAAGNRLGGEFAVNSYTTGPQGGPSVGMDASGDFVVVWQSEYQDVGRSAGIFGQRFDASGQRVGLEFQVNTFSTGGPNSPHVAAEPGGAFAVVWGDSTSLGGRVLMRRFAADGSPQGAPFVVHSPGSSLREPAAAIDAAGRFVVVWTNLAGDGSGDSVEGRYFDADGTPRSGVFRVNTSTTGAQWSPAVTSDSAGNVLAVWISLHENPLSYDVFAQRHGRMGPAGLAVDTVHDADSNGNGVFEPDEGVDVRPSWTNSTSAARDLSAAITSFGGPPGAGYAITDGAGAYGVVGQGVTQSCVDCYTLGISGSTRPALHWDASALEVLNADEDGHYEWTLHVGDSFVDVHRSSPFYKAAETLLHRGVTGGCAPRQYCGGRSTTRQEMAVLVLRSKDGPTSSPRWCSTPMFNDLPISSPFCRWVEELARRGVVSGCGGGNYCPADAVTREQMAIFVLRTLDPALDPPACTSPMFADVPASSPFCPWVEELARRGVVTGCGGGNYCPTAPVTREQMAVFLTATFGLTLYGP